MIKNGVREKKIGKLAMTVMHHEVWDQYSIKYVNTYEDVKLSLNRWNFEVNMYLLAIVIISHNNVNPTNNKIAQRENTDHHVPYA